MKWLSYSGKIKREQNKKLKLINVVRKKFAWLPKETVDDHVVWLQHYYAIYKLTNHNNIKQSANMDIGINSTEIIIEEFYTSIQ